MVKIIKECVLMTMIWISFINIPVYAQDVQLPDPQRSGGMPLMEAINKRRSTREFGSKEIPDQVLSDLLWVAYGFNRTNKRTVPSAWDIQNMSVFVAKADGLFLYDASSQSLRLILSDDIRAGTGTQSYVRNAPVNLVYVADLEMLSSTGDRAEYYSAAHTGFIAQNVYLFCASSGLVTCVRDLIDRDNLRQIMKLEDHQKIILAQSLGYPKGTSKVSGENTDGNKIENYPLSQNFPNPFNAETQIHYTLSEKAGVKITILSLEGETIKTIFYDDQTAGEYTLRWDGLNEHGKRMASGVYFYQIEVNSEDRHIKQTQKMLMLK